MHQIFGVWNFIVTIKACVHFFYFCYQNKTFKKLSKMLFVLPKNILFSSRYQVFVLHFSPLFSFPGRCWFYRRSWLMINSKNHVPKPDFKSTDCLISGKVLILILGQLIEFCIVKVFMERLVAPRPTLVHLISR